MNVFKYHVSCTDGKISVKKIGIILIFRFRRRPIQLVLFVPVGLPSFLHLLQVLCGKLIHPTRLAEDVRTTKGLQERTELIEWDDGET